MTEHSTEKVRRLTDAECEALFLAEPPNGMNRREQIENLIAARVAEVRREGQKAMACAERLTDAEFEVLREASRIDFKRGGRWDMGVTDLREAVEQIIANRAAQSVAGVLLDAALDYDYSCDPVQWLTDRADEMTERSIRSAAPSDGSE